VPSLTTRDTPISYGGTAICVGYRAT